VETEPGCRGCGRRASQLITWAYGSQAHYCDECTERRRIFSAVVAIEPIGKPEERVVFRPDVWRSQRGSPGGPGRGWTTGSEER
jgi:hypothetical protein